MKISLPPQYVSLARDMADMLSVSRLRIAAWILASLLIPFFHGSWVSAGALVALVFLVHLVFAIGPVREYAVAMALWSRRLRGESIFLVVLSVILIFWGFEYGFIVYIGIVYVGVVLLLHDTAYTRTLQRVGWGILHHPFETLCLLTVMSLSVWWLLVQLDVYGLKWALLELVFLAALLYRWDRRVLLGGAFSAFVAMLFFMVFAWWSFAVNMLIGTVGFLGLWAIFVFVVDRIRRAPTARQTDDFILPTVSDPSYPLVSIIMSVFNTEKFVGRAIESILAQTFTAWELLIVDDGSTDRSADIVATYAEKDSRIRLVRCPHQGIAATRSTLIDMATTPYIATMDSDDESMIDRIGREYVYMESHPDCGAVSGANSIIDENSIHIGHRSYPYDVRRILLRQSPLSNPSSMFRLEAFREVGGYREGLDYGEDYDLWLRMYARGWHLANLPQTFLRLRIRSGQTKSSRLRETIRNTIAIQKRAIREYGIRATFGDRWTIFLERLLLLMPPSFVLWLFKRRTYR